MRLYLMRHARAASRADWTAPDAERPLTDEGRARTASAARGLAALAIAPAVAIASPFERTRETAAIVAAELGILLQLEATLQPGADLAALAALLAAHADHTDLLIVGHEPDLSTLIGALIAGKRGAGVEMKKGACACVDLPAGALRKAAEAPERLAGAGTLCWLLTAPQLARLSEHEHGDTDAAGGTTGSDSGAPDMIPPSGPHGSRARRGPAGRKTNAQ